MVIDFHLPPNLSFNSDPTATIWFPSTCASISRLFPLAGLRLGRLTSFVRTLLMSSSLPKTIIIASVVALCSSCAPKGGCSDECGPIIPLPTISLTKLNNQPVSSEIDLPVQRTSGSTIEVTIEFSILRGIDWCRREYQGPLTLGLQNSPSSISKTFDPPIIPANFNQGVAQIGNILLTIPPTVPDGYIPILLNAKESQIITHEYRLVLKTI